MARILALDDDVNMLQYLETVLTHFGHHVMVTTQPHEALTTIQGGMVELLILDIQMPEFNGFDFLQTLRSLGTTTPILMLTGQSSREDVLQAISLGATDYMVKPFKREALVAKVDLVLKRGV